MSYRYPRGWGNTRPPAGSILDGGDSINRGALGRFLFNEGGGGAGYNLANPHKKGVLSAGAAYSNSGGQLSGILTTAASSQYVISNISGVSLAALTVSFWCKRKNTGATTTGTFQWAPVLSSGGPFVFIRESTGVLAFYINSGYNINAGTLSDNVMNHVALTWDGAVWTAYLQGVNIGTHTGGGGGLQSNALDVYLGNGFSGYFDGYFGSTLISSRALSAKEILRLYQEPYAGIYKPRQYWSRAGVVSGGVFIPIVGRGPGRALAGSGGLAA